MTANHDLLQYRHVQPFGVKKIITNPF